MHGFLVNIAPPLAIPHGGEVGEVECLISAKEAHILSKFSDGLKPYWVSLLWCRAFILGEVSPAEVAGSRAHVDIGEYCEALRRRHKPSGGNLRGVLIPDGKILFDWCTLDVLCWLLESFYNREHRGKSVSPADFLVSGEASFPYEQSVADDVFDLAIGEGVGIDCRHTKGKGLVFRAEDVPVASSMREELEERLLPSVVEQQMPEQADTAWKQHEVFICLASEDESVAGPLHKALTESGITVFYYKTSMKWGDSERRTMDSALAVCRYGIPILSKHFFAKPWPQYELDGLAERQMSEDRRVILPIWHNITKQEIMKHSPSLAGIHAEMSTTSVDVLVAKVREMLGR